MKVVTCHAAFYGWLLAMDEALVGRDVAWVSAMWRAGLAATFQARIGVKTGALAVLPMRCNTDFVVLAFGNVDEGLGSGVHDVKETNQSGAII